MHEDIYAELNHYYGDTVRALFVAIAIISVVAVPFFGQLLPFGATTEVSAALVLVLLAGLTNPHSRTIMLYNAIISGVGAFFLTYSAVSSYQASETALFAGREVAAIMFVFAFYYSVKTLRAMVQNKVGRLDDDPREFIDQDSK